MKKGGFIVLEVGARGKTKLPRSFAEFEPIQLHQDSGLYNLHLRSSNIFLSESESESERETKDPFRETKMKKTTEMKTMKIIRIVELVLVLLIARRLQ